MVRFPLAGKPVRHIAGGLGNEECPEHGGEGRELAFATGICGREVFEGGGDVDGHGVNVPDSIASRTGEADCRSLQIDGYVRSKF